MKEAQPSASPSRTRRAGIVVGAWLGLLVSFGALYLATLPFLMIPIQKEFGWGREATGSLISMVLIGVTIGSPVVGLAIDRLGTRYVLGCSLTAFALLLLAPPLLLHSLAGFLWVNLAIGLCGAACTPLGWQSTLPRWFDRHLGMALGVSASAIGIGSTVSPSLAAILIEDFGWRPTLIAEGIILWIMGITGLYLVSPPPPAGRDIETPIGPAPVSGAPDPGSSAATLRDPRLWLLLGSSMVASAAILGAAAHGAALAQDHGFSLRQAAAIVGVSGAGVMIARLGTGILLDRLFAPAVAAGVFLSAGVGLVLQCVAGGASTLTLAFFLTGFAMGAETDLIPYLVLRYFGKASFGTVFGWAMVAYSLGAAVGPYVYGAAFDRFGTYSGVLLASAAASAAVGASAFLFGPYRHPPREAADTATDMLAGS